MSVMKGIAHAVITMYQSGTSIDEIQKMLDRMDYNQSKAEILAVVNNLSQQQVAQTTRQGEDDA